MTINFNSLSRRKDPRPPSPTLSTKTRPTHFPPTPFQSQTTPTQPNTTITTPLPPLLPDSDPFAKHNTAGQRSSIYDTFVAGRPSYDPYSTQAARTTQGGLTSRRSIDGTDKGGEQTLDPSSTFGSKRKTATQAPALTGVNNNNLPTVILPPKPYHSRSSSQSKQQDPSDNTSNNPFLRHNMRPSPLDPNPMTLPPDIWETPQNQSAHRHPSRRGGVLDDMPEGVEDDAIHGLTPGSGLLSPNQSSVSVTSKLKADKILGLETGAKLASFYLVSGLPKEYPAWSFADTDATQGVQPIEDSLGLWWRPDVLASAYSGQNTEDFLKEVARRRKESKASTTTTSIFSPFGGASTKGIHVPDAGAEGAKRLMSKTMKYAHPRDVEVVNSTLAPPTTCHAFTFTIPKQDTISGLGRTTRLNPPTPSPGPNYDDQHYGRQSMLSTVDDSPQQPPPRGVPARTIRNSSSPTEIAYHGVTLTVWTHADSYRSGILKEIKARAQASKNPLDSLRSNPLPSTLGNAKRSSSMRGNAGKRGLPWGMARQQSDTDMTASETEAGMSDSDMEGPLGRRAMRGIGMSVVDCLPEDAAAVFEDGGDVYWMPYAITMVSRHPIYDALQDFLRLSWARYSKNAKHHMTQVCRVLNFEIPRPGEGYRIQLTNGRDEPVTVEGVFPGALDFERGLVKVDFQMWPLFQALDVEHILTCAEIALSNSGRIVFCSKHPAMLNIAVNTLKYIVDLRGWAGISLPIIHARDMNFIIEDPGPYIIGMSTECRYMITIPGEIVLVDIDSNSLMCRSPPVGAISPRPRREKSKLKIFAALGKSYPLDRSIPMEFKVSYPKGTFRNFNKIHYNETQRPNYLGDRVKPPNWWKQAEVIAAFDKVMIDRHKKPSLIQRLTKAGSTRQQAQLTVGEQLAKTMMRKRALHYVDTRDDLEVKVARINRRLLRLVAEGDHWRSQFEMFEKYADRLSQEANELKSKIERERREAKRLSNIANEQSKTNSELEEKLKNTENARAEAMRQLSDMHQSIQELEREREEIMNVFEAQINNALEHAIDDDASTRPSTPTESVLSSPRSRMTVGDQDGLGRLRPYTRESGRSGLSKFTTESAAVSVLGAARGEVAKKIRPGTSGNEGIALRIQSIQQKLEMALNNVTVTNTHQRSHSVASNATDNDTGDLQSSGLGLEVNAGSPNPDDDRRDSAADTTIETPVGSRRPSRTAFPTIIPATPHEDPISPKTLPKSNPNLNPEKSSLEVEIPRSTPSPLPPISDEGSDITQRERKISTSTLGLKKPGGVGLRIKRRDREVSASAGSIKSGGGTLGGHEKGGSGVTESSSGAGSEILVSPHGSGFADLASEGVKQSGGVVGDKDEEMRRLSVVSTGTVAFGV